MHAYPYRPSSISQNRYLTSRFEIYWNVQFLSDCVATSELPHLGRDCRLYVLSVPSTVLYWLWIRNYEALTCSEHKTRPEQAMLISVMNDGGGHFQSVIGDQSGELERQVDMILSYIMVAQQNLAGYL